jgi:hypothetical protein
MVIALTQSVKFVSTAIAGAAGTRRKSNGDELPVVPVNAIWTDGWTTRTCAKQARIQVS